ncbi:type VI secretion system ATPase TssH, partial [Vibrio parahaemolyticus]|nr:type VI secretion system ATPase TssH [Vibrio parahaemolyticus]
NLTAPPKRLAQIEGQMAQRTQEIKLLERAQLLGLPCDDVKLVALRAQNAQVESEKATLLSLWSEQQELANAMIAVRAELNRHELSLEEQSAHQALLATYQARWEAIPSQKRLIAPYVDATQIAEVIADWTGVPVTQMSGDELHKITHLTSWLQQDIKGQTMAIERIHRHLLTARADLRRAGRPKGAFLLVGPSGVGKTETVVQLTEQLYGGKSFLTTIN